MCRREPDDQRLARRLGRWQRARRHVVQLHRPAPTARAPGPGLLDGRHRRRHLQLQRRLLRLHGRQAAQQADGRHGRTRPTGRATGRSPPTAASSPSATPSFYGSMGGKPLNTPDRRHGRHARRQGLLGGRLRRRPLLLRRRPASTAPWAASRSTSRWWASRRRPTGGATGRWPPTVACSPSATPVLRLHGRQAAQQADRGHRGGDRRCRLLRSGYRRRHLQLRVGATSSGRPGSLHLNTPVVGIASAPDNPGLLDLRHRRRLFNYGTGHSSRARPARCTSTSPWSGAPLPEPTRTVSPPRAGAERCPALGACGFDVEIRGARQRTGLLST